MKVMVEFTCLRDFPHIVCAVRDVRLGSTLVGDCLHCHYNKTTHINANNFNKGSVLLMLKCLAHCIQISPIKNITQKKQNDGTC